MRRTGEKEGDIRLVHTHVQPSNANKNADKKRNIKTASNGDPAIYNKYIIKLYAEKRDARAEKRTLYMHTLNSNEIGYLNQLI